MRIGHQLVQSVAVRRDFFQNGVASCVRFAPTADCAEKLRRFVWRARYEAGVVQIYSGANDAAPLMGNVQLATPLSFFLTAQDRHFPVYPAPEATPGRGVSYAARTGGSSPAANEMNPTGAAPVETTLAGACAVAFESIDPIAVSEHRGLSFALKLAAGDSGGRSERVLPAPCPQTPLLNEAGRSHGVSRMIVNL